MSTYLKKYTEKLQAMDEEQLIREFKILYRLQDDENENLNKKFEILSSWLKENNLDLLDTLKLEIALDNEEEIEDEILHALKAQNRLLGEKIRGNERIVKQLVELIGIDLSFIGFMIVDGDSMTDVGFNTGDILLYNMKYDLKTEDIIVIEVNEMIYVKRFRVIKGKKWILPENKNYKGICLDKTENWRIIGVVSKVLKSVK